MAQGFISRRGAGIIGSKSAGMFFQVELPRSIYYESAAEWYKLTDASIPGDLVPAKSIQAMCGGNLWVIGGGKAYCVRPDTGEVTETVDNELFSLDGANFLNSYPGTNYADAGSTVLGICCSTDGTRNIYFSSIPEANYESGGNYRFRARVYQFDTVSKTIETKIDKVLSIKIGTSTTSSYGLRVRQRGMAYNPKNNTIYWFGIVAGSMNGLGGSARITSLGDSSCVSYNLTTSEQKDIKAFPSPNVVGCYCYVDTDSSIYLGAGVLKFGTTKSAKIYRYEPNSDTWSEVGNEKSFPDEGFGTAKLIMGDSVLFLDSLTGSAYNPKTGDQIEGQSPTALGFDLPYPYCGSIDNSIMAYGNNEIKRCVFYQDLPENAPIVAKIYKGQKYHSTVPFEIPGAGISVKTTQQEADRDLEIKMYQYDAAGGQIIYIET